MWNKSANKSTGSPNAGRQPVSPSAPAGTPVRDDPRFDALQAEIDAMTAISAAPRAVNWEKVVTLSSDLLTGLGKDILVACWLGAGLLRVQGVEGIAGGAAILADMCAAYWDKLYPPPKRLNARLNALNWWQEQAKTWLSNNASSIQSQELCRRAGREVERLQKTISGLYEGGELNLGGLSRSLQELGQRISAAPLASAVSPPAKKDPAPAASGKGAPAAASEQGELTPAQSLSQCLSMCRFAADALILEDSANPASYILRRACLWAGLSGLPPVQAGRTLLPAPPSHILPGLKRLAEGDDLPKALYAAESRVNEFIYWLDLSACSAVVLNALGRTHSAALRSLEGQVSAFIHRFPQLADMTFEDGTPFAGPDTKSWLARLSAPAASGRQESAPADQPALIKDLPPLEAITVLQDMLPQEGRGKERLAIYSAMCRAAREGRFWDLLVPLARHIMELIAQYKLSGFDPEAVINILSPLRSALGAALADRPDSRTRECLSEVSDCLCRLRPLELLEGGAGG